jgi:hypothetical protein
MYQYTFLPQVALSFILASAMAAPQHFALGHAGLAHATQSVGPAPLATHPLTAGPVVPHPVNYVAPPAPAPFVTAAQAEGLTTVHQPAPVVTKQIHLGQTSYVSGYATRILKPATPHLPISVPTLLRGSVAYNAPIIKEQVEVHNVQNPVLVERRVEVPYDVPVYRENIISVPTPVHVDAPYNVLVPTPVAGEPIIKHTQAAAVVTHSQHHVDAGVQGYAHGAYAAAGHHAFAGHHAALAAPLH